MSESIWFHLVPWQSDLGLALQELREDVFHDGRSSDLLGDVARSTGSKARAVAARERLNDAKAGRERMRAEPTGTVIDFATRARRGASAEAPAEPEAEPDFEQLLARAGRSGPGSVLGIVDVGTRSAAGTAAPLGRTEMQRLFPSGRPTRRDFRKVFSELESLCAERAPGSATYLVLYDLGQPSEIAFFGSTVESR